MPTRPTKLNTAASASAAPGVRQRVETALAMALGASVAPLTTMTPILSSVTATSTGLEASSATNAAHSMVMNALSTKRSNDSAHHQFNVKPRNRKTFATPFYEGVPRGRRKMHGAA